MVSDLPLALIVSAAAGAIASYCARKWTTFAYKNPINIINFSREKDCSITA